MEQIVVAFFLNYYNGMKFGVVFKRISSSKFLESLNGYSRKIIKCKIAPKDHKSAL